MKQNCGCEIEVGHLGVVSHRAENAWGSGLGVRLPVSRNKRTNVESFTLEVGSQTLSNHCMATRGSRSKISLQCICPMLQMEIPSEVYWVPSADVVVFLA